MEEVGQIWQFEVMDGLQGEQEEILVRALVGWEPEEPDDGVMG